MTPINKLCNVSHAVNIGQMCIPTVLYVSACMYAYLFSLCIAQAHIKFKDMAKNKMLSKLKEVQEKERLASKFQCEYSALKNECEHLSAQKEKTQREMESWRALAKVIFCCYD